MATVRSSGALINICERLVNKFPSGNVDEASNMQ